MKVKRKILLGLCILAFMNTCAQTIQDLAFSSQFRAEVKSLDEFMARFNGIESKPGINEDQNGRRYNLISLFDFSIDKKGATKEEFVKKINAFVDSVVTHNVQIHISDAGLLAECLCRMKLQGKTVRLSLVLRYEMFQPKMYRWSIVAVKGMDGILFPNGSRYYAINPAEHEIHFMGLQDCFNANPSHAYGYRSKEVSIDALSAFLTMIYAGILKFEIVEKQTFYYYGIPGYVVAINEISRKGYNSGWLITSFDRVTEETKDKLFNKLLDNEK